MVKALQKKYGFEVLLWSVDLSYGTPPKEAADVCKETMHSHSVTWPNVIVPGGWDALKSKYKVDGYGLFLLDKHGKLKGSDLFPETLEPLLKGLAAANR